MIIKTPGAMKARVFRKRESVQRPAPRRRLAARGILFQLLLLLLLSATLLTACGDPPFRGVAPLPTGNDAKGNPALEGTAPPLPGNSSEDPSGGDLPNGGDGKTGSVSFLAAGDIIIHEAVFTDAAKRASALAATDGYAEKYYFTSMFDGVKETVSRADLAFVNFECPIAGDGYGALGYPNFNAPKAAGDAVAALGFDIVNIANNHMLDMDGITTGLKNTADYWRSKDLLTVGGYTKSDYDELRVIEKNGISIAFLSYTYGTNGSRVNSGSPEYLVPRIEDETILRQLKKARSAADAVVVSMHWGDETSYATDVKKANAEQKRLAKLLHEGGADVILGHHPHSLQEVEVFRSPDGRETLCYYSLGNFISTQHPYSNLVGGFASFTLEKSQDGTVRVKDPLLIPNVTYYNKSRGGLQVLLLSDLTEEQVASHGTQLREDYNGKASLTVEDFKNIVKKAVSKDFLPAFLR